MGENLDLTGIKKPTALNRMVSIFVESLSRLLLNVIRGNSGSEYLFTAFIR